MEFSEETVSGCKPWRERKLGTVIETLAAVDRLPVPELSRLVRSTLEVPEILKFCKEKGVYVYSVKEKLEM